MPAPLDGRLKGVSSSARRAENGRRWRIGNVRLLRSYHMQNVAGAAGIEMQLVGEHQRDNAVTAIGAALALRRQGFLRLNVPAIVGGLRAASLPGRFQVRGCMRGAAAAAAAAGVRLR